MIGASRLTNGLFETFMAYAVDRQELHKLTITNAAKDMRYINEMAQDAGLAPVMAAAAKQCFDQVEAAGHGDDFVPKIVDHIARVNGLDMDVEAAKVRD